MVWQSTLDKRTNCLAQLLLLLFWHCVVYSWLWKMLLIDLLLLKTGLCVLLWWGLQPIHSLVDWVHYSHEHNKKKLPAKTALSCLSAACWRAALLSCERRGATAPSTTENHLIRAMAAQLELSTCCLSLVLNTLSCLHGWPRARHPDPFRVLTFVTYSSTWGGRRH